MLQGISISSLPVYEVATPSAFKTFTAAALPWIAEWTAEIAK